MRVVEVHATELPRDLGDEANAVLLRHGFQVAWTSPWVGKATRGSSVSSYFGFGTYLEIKVEAMVSTRPGATGCVRFTRSEVRPGSDVNAVLLLADEFEQTADEVAVWVDQRGTLVEIRKLR